MHIMDHADMHVLYLLAGALPGQATPNGTGRIWLDDVRCMGDEESLGDCSAREVGTHNCVHSEDAGVVCTPGISMKNFIDDNVCAMMCALFCIHAGSSPAASADIACTTGAIRLQGGNETFGRVEICNDGRWGTVCHDHWGDNDARVACRQLGFSSNGATPIRSGFMNGFWRCTAWDGIWLDDVRCTGRENQLIDCPANPIGSHNCNHGKDAGVRCGKLLELMECVCFA
jgi:deleted-in-malignant-brain-tumors protein 1